MKSLNRCATSSNCYASVKMLLLYVLSQRVTSKTVTPRLLLDWDQGSSDQNQSSKSSDRTGSKKGFFGPDQDQNNWSQQHYLKITLDLNMTLLNYIRSDLTVVYHVLQQIAEDQRKQDQCSSYYPVRLYNKRFNVFCYKNAYFCVSSFCHSQ